MAVHITIVAHQYLQMNEEMVTQIRLIIPRLGENLTSNIGKRNKSLLALFDDPINVRRLLSYPMAERDRALRNHNPKRKLSNPKR